MPTGAEFVKLALKRFLSQNRMSNELLDYLQEKFCDGIARIFPSQGLFTFPSGSPPTLTNNGDGTFSLTPDPIDGTDGLGHIVRLTGAGRMTNIPFENNGTDHYWIAMHYIEIPTGVYSNPRTGEVEYDKIVEEIGELSYPQAVTDLGGGLIRLDVDSVFTHGVDFTGRTVRVYLTNPMSADEAVAFEDLPVEYDVGTSTNYVDTLGSLGQSTISMQTVAYQVAALGVSVVQSSSNPFSDEYVILGYVIAGGTGASTDDCVDLSGGGGHTLQKAYDGLSGSGSGNTITADGQAVVIRQENDTLYEHDVANSALRIEKAMSTAIYPATPNNEIGIDIKTHPSTPGMLMARVPLSDFSGGDLLRVEEAGATVVGTATVNLSRGAPLDLTLTGVNAKLRTSSKDLVELSGSGLGQDGLYWLYAVVDGNTFSVRNLDGTTPTFVNDSVTVRFYRPIVMLGRTGAALEINSMQDFLNDYSTGAIQSAIDIDIPANLTQESGTVFKANRDGVGLVFTIDADGNLDSIGHVDTNGGYVETGGGDIKTETGDIIMGAGTDDGGTIYMKEGSISSVNDISIVAGTHIGVSMGGTKIDNCGAIDMDADGTGIDMNGTDIGMETGDIVMGANPTDGGTIYMKDGTIVNASSITITTGTGIGLSMGGKNIDNPTDVTINGGFKYNPVKTHYLIVGAEDAIGDGIATFNPGTQSDEGGQHTAVWGNGASDSYVIFPFSIPVDAIITEVKAIGVQIGDAAIRIELLRQAHTWTGTINDRTSIAGPTSSGTGSGTKVITLSPTHTVLADNKYLVMVKLLDTGEGSVHQVRVKYTQSVVSPSV